MLNDSPNDIRSPGTDVSEQIPSTTTSSNHQHNQDINHPHKDDQLPEYDDVQAPEYRRIDPMIVSSNNNTGTSQPDQRRRQQSDNIQRRKFTQQSRPPRPPQREKQQRGFLFNIFCCGIWYPLCCEGCCDSSGYMCFEGGPAFDDPSKVSGMRYQNFSPVN